MTTMSKNLRDLLVRHREESNFRPSSIRASPSRSSSLSPASSASGATGCEPPAIRICLISPTASHDKVRPPTVLVKSIRHGTTRKPSLAASAHRRFAEPPLGSAPLQCFPVQAATSGHRRQLLGALSEGVEKRKGIREFEEGKRRIWEEEN
ncbi:protein damX [Striga asiatica]|uniref:Protein damX n=1 Tax=Striga asiatica TaxID=4170 RepID=A0A5A7PE02_STRAF|nr:protein damX [Striga asiatica]